MDNAAGESDSCATLRWRRPARRRKDAASCESAAYVTSRAPYRKSVCEAASTPLSTPQPLTSPHNVSISAPLLHPTPYAGFSVLPAAPAISVAHPPPANPPAVCTTISLSPEASFACPASSLPPHIDCEVVDALRLQVEQSVRRARNAEENERQLRLALHEVEENQEAVLRALQEYRHLKVPEGNKLLRERICQLEAENASLRAEIHNKETEMSRKDKENEKLSQQLFDVSCTLEGIQKEHLTLFDRVKKAGLSAAGAGIRFSATAGEALLGASCDAEKKRKETYSSFPTSSPECRDLGNAQQDEEYGQPGEEGVRLAEIAYISSAKCPRSLGTRHNRTGSCSHCNSVGKGLSDEAICATKASHATLPSSPKSSEESAQLQEENNAVLKEALLEASVAVDESGALVREKEGSTEKVRKHEGHVEQLQFKENELKQLLQKRDQEIRQLQETLLQQELAKASVDQVSAKLNARVTALLLQVRQTGNRCEEMEGAYKAKIRSLEERLATYSPPACLEAQTQTTQLSSPSPLREFLELNTERFSLLAFDMKKRLIASEQEKNDKLLEHERLVEEKELHMSEMSARFASATEEHAAEKKKLHAKVVEVEGELALCRTKHQTTTSMLQKARRRLDDGRITQEALATEKQQEADAHQRVVSSLQLRLQAEKEKLKEALCSMDVTQKHLRRLLQHKPVSAASTQASQAEDRHSVILEIPAEFQAQLDLLSAPHSPDTWQSPSYRDGSPQQRKNKSCRKEEGHNFALQSISLQCKNRVCTQFTVDANERICMLTAALLCKTHMLAIAEERLTLLQRVSKTNYNLTRQLSEERRERLETRRCLSRAEIEWRERVSFLEKQNEKLLQDKKEAVEKVELLHASETKLQRESLMLREEHGLCRKQLEELHQAHTKRASQERRDHEKLLQTLKHYLKKRLVRKCGLQPSTFLSEECTHVSYGLAQAVEHSPDKSPKGLQNAFIEGRIPLSPHSRALEGSAYAVGTDLVGAIQQLTTAATRLFACLEKAQSVGVSATAPTTRCCCSPSAFACRCMASICVKDECTPGYSASTGSEWKQPKKKGGSDHGMTCRSKTMRLCSSAPHACCINSYSPRGREGLLDEIQAAVPRKPLIQHRRTRARQCSEQALQKATSRISNRTNVDTMGKACVRNPIHTCNGNAASVEDGDGAHQQGEGYHRCTKVDIVLPGVNRAAHQSTVSAEVKELLDQLCDLFLCAGQRLADTEQTAAINEVVSALTYKQWQLQKVREAELLRDRALLRHQLTVFKHQLFSQAAGDRLDSGLCKLYRERCEEIEKQLLVAIRQLRIHEEERKQLTSNLRDAQQQAEALQRRLTWTEVRKKEMELLMESTAEEHIMQRLLTFKEEVLESLQTESIQVALVSPLLFCNGKTEANEESGEKLSQLSQQVTQERRERAALHFALKEMQQENKMMLHLLDQKEKQLALMQEMKLLRPADIATTVENTQERRRIQADFTMQKKISPRASGGGTSQPTASSTAISSPCLRLLDMETFPSNDNGVDASQSELLGGLSHLKGVVHQQQVEMLKQAEKLSCCEVEIANLRLRNGSLSNELSRHVSKLSEAQAALEDSARVRARMEEVELWASRLGQAHQAELNSMRYAQKCRLQHISVEWEEKTNKELNALRAENANLKIVTQQLCTDTEALLQQLRRHKEALQRHNVLDELSQAGFGALHTFQLETSLQTKGTSQKTVVAKKRAAVPQIPMQHNKRRSISPGLPADVSQSVFRLGVHINNKPDQRLKNSVPSTVVKCLLQAFVQLCVQLAECERQLLRDFNSSTSASSKRSSSSEAECVAPQPLHLRVLQHPSRETSVLRGQRIVIRWLYVCSVNRLEDSPCAPALATSSTTEVFHPPNASTAQEKAGGRTMTEKAVDTMLSALLSADQSSHPRPAARDLPPQQRRAVLHLKEGARELLSVLEQTCQSLTTTRCAQQLIVQRLTGIERALRLMRRIVGTKHKAERKNSLSKINLEAGSTESLHCRDLRKSRRSSEYSRTRYNGQLHKCRDGITNDGERSRIPSQSYYPFCALRRGRGLASKRIVPEAQFVLSWRAFAASLSETEQLLQLVCSCAEECSSIMKKADLAAEGLSAKLGAIFLSQTKFRMRFPRQADNRGGTHTQAKKILSSKTLRTPPRSWPWFCRSCSSNCRDASENCSPTRGRSLTICRRQWLCPAMDEKFRNRCRYASIPIASSPSTDNHGSSTGDFSRTRRSPDSISSNRYPVSCWSTRAYLRSTTDDSRICSRFSRAHKRTHSFPCSRRARTATSASRRMCLPRSFIRETSEESGQTEFPVDSDTSPLGRPFRENCTHKSSTVSTTTAALPFATTVSPASGSAVNNKLSRGLPSSSGTPAPLSKSGNYRHNRDTSTKACKVQQHVKSDKSTSSARAGEKTGEAHRFIQMGFSPPSSPSAGPSSTKAPGTQQPTNNHVSRRPPRLRPRHRIAGDTFNSSCVDPFDSNFDWSVDSFPARSLQSRSQKQMDANPSCKVESACESSHAIIHGKDASTGHHTCNYTLLGSIHEKKMSGLTDAEWLREETRAQAVIEDTILSLAPFDSAVRRKHNASKCSTLGKTPSAKTLGSELSKIHLRSSISRSTNSDAASIGTARKITFSKCGAKGEPLTPPPFCTGNAPPLSPTRRRVVTLSSRQRHRLAHHGLRRQQLPNMVPAQKSVQPGLVRVHQQGKRRPSKICTKHSKAENISAEITQYGNVANNYETQQVIQPKKHSCTMMAQARAVCMSRPDWLPPLSNSQDFFQNDSAVQAPIKGCSPLVGKGHSPSAAMNGSEGQPGH